MAMEATLQVRMDAAVKEKVEALYRNMGTSFAEAVRMMAVQSLLENGMPFDVTASRGKAYGIASKRAKPAMIPFEKGAFEKAMVSKHVVD